MFPFFTKKNDEEKKDFIEKDEKGASNVEASEIMVTTSDPIKQQEEVQMFGEKSDMLKSTGQSKDISTILDRECTFEGKMTFEGCVVINGKFKGEIFSEGSLIIGEGGVVEGKIEIGFIQIQGEVRGNILAKEKIEILAPAIVQGDISAPSLIIKEGSIFEGNCSMGRQENKNVVDFSSRVAD